MNLAVNYGSTAGTAAQGNTSITCTAGTGNLTGGGNAVTVGAGGTCGAINTVANPSFNSVTIANTTNTNTALLIQNATGVNSLTFDTISGTLKVWDTSVANPVNYAAVSYANNIAIFSASSGITQLGATSGNVTVPLTGTSDTFLFTKTLTAAGAYGTNEYTIQRVVTGGANALSGSVLRVENRSTGTADSTNVLYVNQNNSSATGNVVQVQSAGTTNLPTLDTAGNFNIKNGYQINGTAGATQTCAAGNALVSAVITGGIVTSGACSAGTGTLQTAYDNSATPATVLTSSATKGILFKAGATFDNASLFQVQNSGGINILTTDTANKIVQIGSATSDATQVNLVLDQYNTFTDTGSCNTAANPNGALYYNTASNAIRACIGNSYTDLPSTADLGILMFGVVPDSGTNAGDLPALVTTGVTGPCKVSWTTITSVTVAPCTAYSAGRKVIVPSTTIAITGLSTTAIWAHICLSGANNQPVLSAGATTETANLGTTSLPNAATPIVCLADIKGSAVTANNIAQIYDVRTFTNSQKEYVTLSTAASLGQIVIASGSNAAPTATAASPTELGVVIATNGATSTTTPNAIIVIAGPSYAKAVSGTAGNFVQTSTTSGYAQAATATGAFGNMGISRTTFNGTCTSAATCLGSLYYNEAIR